MNVLSGLKYFASTWWPHCKGCVNEHTRRRGTFTRQHFVAVEIDMLSKLLLFLAVSFWMLLLPFCWPYQVSIPTKLMLNRRTSQHGCSDRICLETALTSLFAIKTVWVFSYR